MSAEFRGEIYYTGYVIIIGDYTLSQFVGVTVEDFSKYIQSYNPQSRKFTKKRHGILLPKKPYQKAFTQNSGIQKTYYNLLTPHTNPYTTLYTIPYTSP